MPTSAILILRSCVHRAISATELAKAEMQDTLPLGGSVKILGNVSCIVVAYVEPFDGTVMVAPADVEEAKQKGYRVDKRGWIESNVDRLDLL